MTDELKKETNEVVAETEAPTFSPELDIIEKKDAYLVLADVPGAVAEGIEVSVENDVLKLRAKVSPPEVEGLPLLYREYETGDYETSIKVSERVAVEKIEARLKDGALTLTLPKREEAKPRQILVRAA